MSVTVATISESDDVTELMPVMNETVQMVLTADNITMGYVQMEDNTTSNNSISHDEMPSDLNATDIVSEGVNTTDMSYWKWLVYQNRTNFLQGTRSTSGEEDEVKVEDFTTEFNLSEKAEDLEATQTWRYIQPYTEGTTHENTQGKSHHTILPQLKYITTRHWLANRRHFYELVNHPCHTSGTLT